MSGPPDWDDAPPGDYGGGGQPRSGGGKRGAPPAMTPNEAAKASSDFYGWLEDPATLAQLKMVLPDHVDIDVFVATAKTAVLTKPQLLRENLRTSLLVAVMKAAGMGLLPDGKQGALVPRYDTDANGYIVAWQPMVQGIKKLGYETGAIRANGGLRAVIVFRGEKFRILAGEDDRIEHEIDIDIVDEAYAALNGGKDNHGNPIARPEQFMARVRAAYCFITAVDGTVTRRWMPHQRLVSLWETSKAAKGPWNSRWIDEMILKGVILFTAKWINLDSETAAAKRFQAALMVDMEVDFDRQGGFTELPAHAAQAALPAPPDKLSTLEDALAGTKRVRETVPANGAKAPTAAAKAATTKEPTKAAPSVDEDAPWIDKVAAALTREASGHKWLNTLIAATNKVETATDLGVINRHPTVVENLKTAPPAHRSQIASLLAAASARLATVDGEDGSAEDPWDAPKTGVAAE